MDKEKRCELANELIKVIANEGRKFFNYENTNYIVTGKQIGRAHV